MAGRLTPSTEPIHVASLAGRVSKEVGARSPDYALVVDIPPDLPPAEGDPELLEQVLRNLYENAIKYSSGGTIRTAASSNGETVTIDVADQGIGIAAEHVPHVFERFRRPGADPTVRGMGLGLYLSRLLVEAQDGRISARSPGPGQGANFSIELPVARGWLATDDET
jgi:signal transduction histidine kinase